MGLGHILKAAREELGFSLEYVHAQTKIQRKFLHAIENDNLDQLPGNFYAKAFIRQYAELVGLDTDELLLMLQKENPKFVIQNAINDETLAKAQKKEPQVRSKWFEFLPKILFITFILVCIGAAYYLLKNYNFLETPNNESGLVIDESNKPLPKSDKTPSEKNKDENKEKETEEQENNKTETKKQLLAFVSKNNDVFNYELTDADKFVVKIVTTDVVWISVKDGTQKSLLQETLKAQDIKEFDLTNTSESVLIRTGNALGTSIYVNDELLAYSAEPSQKTVQTLLITQKK